ncbi:hypothetical protein E2C01_021789 [Portunus trituberculatus]|uniref:Uncharacterized protein n=1 Tax=Portunus trituberculatus TaxID=210409 RepID=A0A5B7E3N9_PORTR|nr:hypothetical protein [Portunus trituberculatus]
MSRGLPSPGSTGGNTNNLTLVKGESVLRSAGKHLQKKPSHFSPLELSFLMASEAPFTAPVEHHCEGTRTPCTVPRQDWSAQYTT